MQTETITLDQTAFADDRDGYMAQFMGRQAVFTTWESKRLVGTITGYVNAGLPQPIVTFSSGQHARLTSTIELVA